MITEIASVIVNSGQEAEFEEMVRHALSLFSRSPGWIELALHRSIETPSGYRLILRWETLANHTIDFSNSMEGEQWRARIKPFLSAPPKIEHFTRVNLIDA